MSRRSGPSEVLSLVGLARRAGAVARGTSATRRSLRAGEALLVLTAEDASPTQMKKVLGLVRARNVAHRVVADRRLLGAAVGSPPLSTVAVTQPSFAERILERISSRSEGREAPSRETGGKQEECR